MKILTGLLIGFFIARTTFFEEKWLIIPFVLIPVLVFCQLFCWFAKKLYPSSM